MIVALLAAALFEAQTPSEIGTATMRAISHDERPPIARVNVSVARQSIAVLRAVTGERVPEQAALYSVRVCASGARAEIDPGRIEHAIVGAGIATTPRALAQLAVTRSRNRGLSALARFGEAASIVAPVVVGFAATGGLSLVAWQVAAISGLGQGLRIASDATKVERDRVGESIGMLGPWLSDMQPMTLEPGRCSSSMLVLGSYDPKRKAEVIEVQ